MKEVSFQESKFVEKFTIFASKMGNEIHLRSLRDAFATIMRCISWQVWQC